MHIPKKIDSSANPEIREIKKISGGKNKSFWLIEGKKLFFEAIESGIRPEKIFVTKRVWEEDLARLQNQSNVHLIPEKLMKSITTLETPPGILAVARRIQPAEINSFKGMAMFVNSIRDPGNLGALIRTCEAAGYVFVACSHDSADPFSSKVLRASMGSLFRIPVFRIMNTLDYLNNWKEKNVTMYALSPHSGTNLYEVKPKTPLMLIVGGETAGLPSGFSPDYFLTIPMNKPVESLNAAIAGSIAIFKLKNAISK